MKNKGILKWIIGAVLLVVLAFFGFTAEVREGEYAVITRFGAVRSEVTEAGLYFKLPWPFENVTKYDVRNQYTESSYLETLTKGGENIILQSYAVWNVSDPLLYHQRIGDDAVAEQRINDLIINATNGILGKYELSNVVSTNPEQLCLAEIENAIFEQVQAHATTEYGITVSQVSIMRLSLPEENLSKVFEQMSSDRQAIIDDITAKGSEEASKITNDAEVLASTIIAGGVQNAANTKKETEQEVAAIYAQAQAENKALFKFLLELDTVVNSVGSDTVLIVKKGEFLEGLFSQEVLDMVKKAQESNEQQGSSGGTQSPTP